MSAWLANPNPFGTWSPPCDPDAVVDLELGGTLVPTGGCGVRYNQRAGDWDWSPQDGAEIKRYRIREAAP